MFFIRFDAVNPKIQPLHWRDPDVPISFRSEFKPHPNRPVLVIKKTQLEDSGNYKCRVDYFLEQTTFQLIDLVVIIPPRKPQIYLDNGLAVEDTYSVKENQTIQLTCESVGGHPLPRLTWWKDGELIDSSFQKYFFQMITCSRIIDMFSDYRTKWLICFIWIILGGMISIVNLSVKQLIITYQRKSQQSS